MHFKTKSLSPDEVLAQVPELKAGTHLFFLDSEYIIPEDPRLQSMLPEFKSAGCDARVGLSNDPRFFQDSYGLPRVAFLVAVNNLFGETQVVFKLRKK